MLVDADILEYFRKRAEHPNASPYQTQMNNVLRQFMAMEGTEEYSKLLNNERFIEALAQKLAQRSVAHKQ